MKRISISLFIWFSTIIALSWAQDASKTFIVVGLKGEIASVDLTSKTVDMKVKSWTYKDVVGETVLCNTTSHGLSVAILTRDTNHLSIFSDINDNPGKILEDMREVDGVMCNTENGQFVIIPRSEYAKNECEKYPELISTKFSQNSFFMQSFSYPEISNRYMSLDKIDDNIQPIKEIIKNDYDTPPIVVGRSSQITTLFFRPKERPSNKKLYIFIDNTNHKYLIHYTKESARPFTFSKTSVLMHYMYSIREDGGGAAIDLRGNYTVFRNSDMSLHQFSVAPEYRVVYCDDSTIYFGYNPENNYFSHEYERKHVLYSYPYASEGEKEIKVEMQLPFGPFMMFPIESQSAQISSSQTPSPTSTPEARTNPLSPPPTANPSPVTPIPEPSPQATTELASQATTSNNNKVLYAAIAALILLAGAGIILLRRKRN